MTPRQIALIAAPPLLFATTASVFTLASRRFGAARGYLAGFVFYWVGWCLLMPLWAVGPSGLQSMFGPAQPPNGGWVWLLLALTALPPLVMAYRAPAAYRGLSRAAIVASILFALPNGVLQEVLWRGTYLTVFPESWVWAVAYPALGFGQWHLAPLIVNFTQAPGIGWGFVLLATAAGVLWGIVAWVTGSILWLVIAHVLLHLTVPIGGAFLPQRQTASPAPT